MRKFITLVVLTISFSAKAQTHFDSLVSLCRKETMLSRILPDTTMKRHSFEKESIDFGIEIYRTSANRLHKSAPTIKPGFQIEMYVLDDTILSCKMIKEIETFQAGESNITDSSFFASIDSVRLSQFIQKHNAKYFSNWTLNDFVDAKSNLGVFGFQCGFLGTLTPEISFVIELVKTKNIMRLMEMASSFSVLDRAFGTAGLYFLKRRREKMTQVLLQLIAVNQKSEFALPICDFCVESEGQMKISLTDEKLMEIYDDLVRWKLFDYRI